MEKQNKKQNKTVILGNTHTHTHTHTQNERSIYLVLTLWLESSAEKHIEEKITIKHTIITHF